VVNDYAVVSEGHVQRDRPLVRPLNDDIWDFRFAKSDGGSTWRESARQTRWWSGVSRRGARRNNRKFSVV
jgi:hypothetical protein